MSELVVGMLGQGTVGSGVVRILEESGERLGAELGRAIRLKTILVRDAGRERIVRSREARLVTDPREVLDDPEIQVIVEVMGGLDPAEAYLRRALENGKDVVTANKALLAERGEGLFGLGKRLGRAIAFEAAVGGGIPIIAALATGLAANRILGVAGILNGTCNTILTAMTEEGTSYNEALAHAQALGLAEADPTLDVNGTDTAHKLVILVRLGFGRDVGMDDVPCEGIDRLQALDVRNARELGYVIKLLAVARRVDGDTGALVVRVAPALVRRGTPLAEVRGPYNAIRVVGDAVGDTLLYGRGAGGMPTASAVVGDLLDVGLGRALSTARALDRRFAAAEAPRLAAPEEVRSRYYLRVSIADRPGMLGTIALVLGRHGVSIASVIQHDPGDDERPGAPVPLVFMTHVAREGDVRRAIGEINRLEGVTPPCVCLAVED